MCIASQFSMKTRNLFFYIPMFCIHKNTPFIFRFHQLKFHSRNVWFPFQSDESSLKSKRIQKINTIYQTIWTPCVCVCANMLNKRQFKQLCGIKNSCTNSNNRQNKLNDNKKRNERETKKNLQLKTKHRKMRLGWCSNRMDKRHEIPIYFKLKCKFAQRNQFTHSARKRKNNDDQIQWKLTNEQIQSNVDNILSLLLPNAFASAGL